MATNARIGPVERATNRTWDQWLQFMAAIGAEELDHGQIALRVDEEIVAATAAATAQFTPDDAPAAG